MHKDAVVLLTGRRDCFVRRKRVFSGWEEFVRDIGIVRNLPTLPISQ
jgi:hypothetical protein